MNILIVDDHPMTVEGFMSALLKKAETYNPTFKKAYSCQQAYNLIQSHSKEKHFDLAIVDHGLPSYEAQQIYSGVDLAFLIRKKMPDCKIIMITAHTEIIIIYDIAKKIRPEGLVIKNDVTPENLPSIVKAVIDGHQYQSPLARNSINEIWKKELMIDDNNRQILFYLSKGFKVKELEPIICLTTSTIQKRIIRMKRIFQVNDDTGLVKEAIKQGFI